jgi:hypothetical protein
VLLIDPLQARLRIGQFGLEARVLAALALDVPKHVREPPLLNERGLELGLGFSSLAHDSGPHCRG